MISRARNLVREGSGGWGCVLCQHRLVSRCSLALPTPLDPINPTIAHVYTWVVKDGIVTVGKALMRNCDAVELAVAPGKSEWEA